MSFNKRVFTILIIFFCLIGICGCEKKTKVKENKSLTDLQEEYVDIHNKETFKVGEYFQSQHFKVKVSKVYIDYKPESQYDFASDGNMFVKVIIEATNIGSENDDISLSYFKMYADGNNADGTMIVEDHYDDFGGDIAPNKTTTGPLYFEVPIKTKKIVLKYTPYILDTDYQVEFKLK